MLSEPEKKEFFEIVQDFKQKLGDKASKHYAVIQRVEWWTERQPFLTGKVCSLILESQSTISAGEEASIVDALVRTRLVENWENQVAAEHLKKIRDSILESDQPASLLRLYQQILQPGTVAANSSQEQQALLKSKLVVKMKGQLRVDNRIYEAVFDRDWVAQELGKYEQSLNSESTTDNQNMEDNTEEEKSPSRLHSIVGIGFVMIVIGVAVVSFLNRPPGPSTTSPETCGSDLIKEIEDAVEEFDEKQLQQIIDKLKNKRQQQGGTLDEECEKILYDAQYKYAIELKARDPRLNNISSIMEAVKVLCEIPEEYYRNRDDDKPWFKRWSNMFPNSNFTQELDEYLDSEEPNKCPAASYLNRDL